MAVKNDISPHLDWFSGCLTTASRLDFSQTNDGSVYRTEVAGTNRMRHLSPQMFSSGNSGTKLCKLQATNEKQTQLMKKRNRVEKQE